MKTKAYRHGEIVFEIVDKKKYAEIDGGSKEVPYKEYPTADPENPKEALSQYIYNQAISNISSSLKALEDKQIRE